MNDSIYYLVTIDFFNENRPEPDTIQCIITGSCYVNAVERIFKDIADNDDVLGLRIEEIGEYPTLKEINDFINKRK